MFRYILILFSLLPCYSEVKTDIWNGTFTEEDVNNLLPFENQLILIEMTGAQIVAVLEQSLEHVLETNATGAYPYAAGLRYSIDYGKNFSYRCTNVEVNMHHWQDDPSLDVWTPIELEQEYNVVTTSFLASGGDGYDEFANALPEKVRPT